MNLFCMKCLMFTKNNNTKIKCEIDEKNNLCIHCSSKKFEMIDKKELSDSLKA